MLHWMTWKRQSEMECVKLADIKGIQLRNIKVFDLLTSKYKKKIFFMLAANNYLTCWHGLFCFPFVAVYHYADILLM